MVNENEFHSVNQMVNDNAFIRLIRRLMTMGSLG
jgi:hypothetical protein